MGANELSAALWRQRELLNLLLFKYDEQHLLLAAGKSKWVPNAVREIEVVVEQVQTAGLRIAVVTVDVAREWGISEEAKLRDIVEAAPTPVWRDLFSKHLEALRELTAAIRQVRDKNDQLVRHALRSTQEMLNALATPADTYTADGASDRGGASPALVDTKA